MTWAKIDEDLYEADKATSSLYATRLIANIADDARYIHISTGRAWDATVPPVFSTAPGFTRCIAMLHAIDPYVDKVAAYLRYQVANGAAAAGTDGVRARLRVGSYVGTWSDLDVTSAQADTVLSCEINPPSQGAVVIVAIEVESYLGTAAYSNIGLSTTGDTTIHVHINTVDPAEGKSHFALALDTTTFGDPNAARQYWHIGRIDHHTHGGGNDSIAYIWPAMVASESLLAVDDNKVSDCNIYYVGAITVHGVALVNSNVTPVVPPINPEVGYSRAPMTARDVWMMHRTIIALRNDRARVWGVGALRDITAGKSLFGARVTSGDVSRHIVQRRPSTSGVDIFALVLPLRQSSTAITLTARILDDTMASADSTTQTLARTSIPAPSHVPESGSAAAFNVAWGQDPTTWGQADTVGPGDVVGATGAPVLTQVGIDWPAGSVDGDWFAVELESSAPLHVFDVITRERY